MSQVKFEGDLSNLSAQQLEYISSVFAERGFKDSVVTMSVVGEAGDNYVADVKRMTAEKNGKTFKIIAKVAPKAEQLRAYMGAHNLFINEHVMYTEVLPKFTELEKSADIQASERFRYAACYGTFLQECEEMILLEDLKESNFTILDRFKSLTDNEVKIVLKSFARYHSLSYALKHKEPETFDNFRHKLYSHWKTMSSNELANQQFAMLEKECISILNDEKHKNAVKGTLSNLPKMIKNITTFDEYSRFSVIQQGDSWTNNIMFQLKDEIAVSCCLIDYQLSFSNVPVADLQYFLFNCTDYETRKSNFFEWIDYYHTELTKSLSEFGLKANYVYPRDQLDADLKRHGKMTLAQCVLLAFGLSRESAEAAKLKEAMQNVSEENMNEMKVAMGMSSMSVKTLGLFKARVQGAVESLLQFGLL